MEINNEILSALSLINSAHIDRDDLLKIFEQCNKTLSNQTQDESTQCSDDKSILHNILSFAINSLLLESTKNNINQASLIRLLQEHKLDCSTENFKLFINYINSSREKVFHNVNQLELNPLPKFRGMEWSQILDIKSSRMDSIKEKNYLFDLYVDQQDQSKIDQKDVPSVFSMILSQKELQDLHFTLSDCAKSLENFVSK